MDEVRLVDKPKGWTSFDVVGKIRADLREKTGQKIKVGHAGTLDPLATGLLIVLIGKATKRQDEFMKLDKVYEVEMKLGETSTTADEEGEKKVISHTDPGEKAVLAVLRNFQGISKQVPPAYSAIKVNGQRAYKMAREGKEVIIEPRTVNIHSISDVIYRYPIVKFTTKVSSGTYIRSLVTDIGEKLGTGAYMTNLRRTKVGKFNLSEALPVSSVIKGLHSAD